LDDSGLHGFSNLIPERNYLINLLF